MSDAADSLPMPMPDHAATHRHWAVECFNLAWSYIEMPERTPEQDEEMIRLAHASHFHWTQRKDAKPVNENIAHWQLSRVYALAGHPALARQHGQRCLDLALVHDLEPFYAAYGHEALARAALLADDPGRAAHHLAEARALAAQVLDDHDRNLLTTDLDTLEGRAG